MKIISNNLPISIIGREEKNNPLLKMACSVPELVKNKQYYKWTLCKILPTQPVLPGEVFTTPCQFKYYLLFRRVDGIDYYSKGRGSKMPLWVEYKCSSKVLYTTISEECM